MNQHEIESELKSLRECMNESYQRQDDLEKDLRAAVVEISSMKTAMETLRHSVTTSLAENTTVLRHLSEAMLGSLTDRKKIGLIPEHEAVMKDQAEIIAFHTFIKRWYWMILGAAFIVGGGGGIAIWQLIKLIKP